MQQNAGVLYIWLANLLRATGSCDFWASEVQKWPENVVFYMSWLENVRRGLQFFPIGTSKIGPSLRCFARFDLKMFCAPQRRAIFPDRNFQNWSLAEVFGTFWLTNVLRATAACHFSFLCWTATSAPAALARLLFEHQQPRIIEKTQRFATFLTFGACLSSF